MSIIQDYSAEFKSPDFQAQKEKYKNTPKPCSLWEDKRTANSEKTEAAPLGLTSGPGGDIIRRNALPASESGSSTHLTCLLGAESRAEDKREGTTT